MRNNNSTDGLAEDLIRAVVQFGCSEAHIKTLIEKATAELDNGLIDVEDPAVLQKHLDKIDALRSMMEESTDMRRRLMVKLFSLGSGDKDYWCLVKHLGTGCYQAYETYMASDDDAELYNIWLDSNKIFVKAMTGYLGYEVTDCAACLHDYLKGEQQNGN